MIGAEKRRATEFVLCVNCEVILVVQKKKDCVKCFNFILFSCNLQDLISMNDK